MDHIADDWLIGVMNEIISPGVFFRVVNIELHNHNASVVSCCTEDRRCP